MFHALVGKRSQASSFPQADLPIRDGGVQPLFWVPGTGVSTRVEFSELPAECTTAMPVWDMDCQHLALQCYKAARESQPSCHRPLPGTGGGSRYRAGLGTGSGDPSWEKAQRGLSSGPYLHTCREVRSVLYSHHIHCLWRSPALPTTPGAPSAWAMRVGTWHRDGERGGGRSQTSWSRLQAPVQVVFSRPLSPSQQIQ